MQRLRLVLLVALAVLSTAPAYAVLPDERLAEPALEARARALTGQIRCLVCQSESIDDSEASLARDLRILVRERIKAGDSDEAVKSFLAERYGDVILLKPPFAWRTALLWAAPFILLGAGGLIIFAAARRRQQAAPALTEAEKADLERILGQNE